MKFLNKLKIFVDVLPPITTPAPGYCPNTNWLTYGAYCYFIERTARSYPDAKFDCSQKGATVVSLTSKGEMEYLTQNIDARPVVNQIWIGLEKSPVSNAYEWSDGSSLSFTSFSPNFQSRQTCAYMSANEWFDSDCFLYRRIYVCKRSKSNFCVYILLLKVY